ncbi:hypothetical protein [Variovorax soli]|uniref:Uncharacterized protein n=1 Tax=Variovorax soli TaxID=376815 RepID=A0ABU1NET4_9BURK|nr:hypothetical protein [Variovorax soli]MDR6536978.1 hypothetical protein [Variovorax soli]
MNWIGMVVGAVCGAVGALVATLILGKKSGEGVGRLVSLAVFAMLFGLSREYVTPILHAHYNAYGIDGELSKSPAWVAMKAYEPVTYNRILDAAQVRLRGGENMGKVTDEMAANVQALILKRVPTTSDVAAVAYMRVMMEEIKVLSDRGDDSCYRFLMPEGAVGHSDLIGMLPKDLAQRDGDALAEVFRAAVVEARPVPTEAQFMEAFRPAVMSLQTLNPRYVTDLEALGKPQTTLASKRYTCELTMALYGEVFKLPRDAAGLTLRYLIASAG